VAKTMTSHKNRCHYEVKEISEKSEIQLKLSDSKNKESRRLARARYARPIY